MMLGRLLKIHDFFCLAVTFKEQHDFCSNSWFGEPSTIINVLKRCLPWPSCCICSSVSIQQARSPGRGGWEGLSSNWNRRSFRLLLSQVVAIWPIAAVQGYCSSVTSPAGSFLPVNARNCLVLKYLTPFPCLPPTALARDARSPLRPAVQRKADQYSHVPGSSMHYIPAKTKSGIFQSSLQ